MALTLTAPAKKANNKPTRVRTHIITLFKNNVLVETRSMILYKLVNDRVWLPKKDLWINSFLTDTFILPIYENDNETIIRVIPEGSKEEDYQETDLRTILNDILKDMASFANYAMAEESKSKPKK